MKVVLIICGMATLVAILVSCGKKKQEDPIVLNYENMIFLDAEELGEGSIGSSYKKDIVPIL